jgi:hypothetical protein
MAKTTKNVKTKDSGAKPAETIEEKVIPLKVPKPPEKKTGVFTRFASTKAPQIPGVEEALGQLPLMKISEAGDFVRVSPDVERHWSPPLCFVNVPVQGEKRDLLHLIDEELAMKHLPSKKIKRMRLALASKPYGIFFLAIVPVTNLDNPWNSSMMSALEKAKTKWVEVTSRKDEGKEEYKSEAAKDPDAFPEPAWPSDVEPQVEVTFSGRTIETENDPAFLRVTGRKQIINK